MSGDLNSAERILQQLLTDAANNQGLTRAKTLRRLGVVYFSLRRYEDAFSYFESALSLAVSLKSNMLIALGYNDLSNIYHVYGDLETSAQLLQKSYDLHGIENHTLGQASVLNNLGTIYRDKEAYDEAIVSYRRAYVLFSQIGQPLRAAQTLSNLGESFYLNGDTDKAIELLTQAAEQLTQLNSFRFLADIYVLLAEISVNNQTTSQAQHWLEQSKLSANLVQNSEKNPRFWYVQGIIWEKEGKYQQAFAAFDTAYTLIVDDNEFKLQELLYTAMAKLSEKTKDYQASSRYWRLYAQTLNSQLNLKDVIHSRNIRSTFTFEPEPLPMWGPWLLLSVALILLVVMAIVIHWFRHRHVQFDANADVSLVSATNQDSKMPVSADAIGNSAAPIEPTGAEALAPPSAPAPQISAFAHVETNEANNDELVRTQLVELMHQALLMWEESTQTGKLELAQQSKIWNVAIDDGRLRARAMERYFSLNTLPQNPRWRSVVRTCNYVLQKCQGKSLFREELEINLKSFQERKSKSMIKQTTASATDEPNALEAPEPASTKDENTSR
ncbi:tetratricopeptide repeat protein [Shewanella sp. NIFS-20-20]|uniref:tetratricopeptide repeat protein n=1 Tax=Shewanella sp. NIFS-20-20 TaxID=2853806 RepID=UPI001C457F0B|nr:tetratricopeptide repeat protein [Shewanella sp. NIFS-20-20]MBV7314955.1 tetratricopeptide repeat protein [Shewanella sp. NIFS-20-20]